MRKTTYHFEEEALLEGDEIHAVIGWTAMAARTGESDMKLICQPREPFRVGLETREENIQALLGRHLARLTWKPIEAHR